VCLGAMETFSCYWACARLGVVLEATLLPHPRTLVRNCLRQAILSLVICVVAVLTRSMKSPS